MDLLTQAAEEDGNRKREIERLEREATKAAYRRYQNQVSPYAVHPFTSTQ